MPTDVAGRFRRYAPYALLGAAGFAGHAVYPASLWLLTAGRPARRPPSGDEWPSLTVLVAAYREAAVIAEKIADAEANGYPGDLEILVVADDPATAVAARAAGATVLAATERRGKAAALAEGLLAAKGDVVVLTDANAMLAPGSLEALARWFHDPAVGAVAGEKRHSHGGEGLYWSFESWLKRRESRLGLTIGLVGECAAVRRSAAPQLPAWVVVDDFWLAIDLRRSGWEIAYEPTAVAVEAPAKASEEWQRRTRIVAGAIQMLSRERDALGPADLLLAYEIWGHRLWRMTVGPVASVALAGLAARRSFGAGPDRRLARVVLGANIAAGVAALAGDRLPRPLRVAGQVAYLQVVGLGGMARLFTRDVRAKWPKPERRAVS